MTARQLCGMARRFAAVPAVAALLLGLGAAPAAAAVPASWLGVMADGPLLRDPAVDLEAEMRLMAGSGVGTVRVAFYWSDIERVQGIYDWREPDRVVLAAAQAGLRVLPTVVRTPPWAADRPGLEGPTPLDPGHFARFLRTTVTRYGPQGVLWRERPDVRALPLRWWQVWNEPDLRLYWLERPWAPGYAALLRRAYRAIKRTDPGAKVISAGLTNRSWEGLERLYRAGAGRSFDLAAIHPFSRRPKDVLRIVRLARRTMARHGDADKPLVLSEITWSSGAGARARIPAWTTTERGQAARIRQALPMLARLRHRFRIAAVSWYTWLSPEPGLDSTFLYSGLRRMDRGRPVSKPALEAFRSVARRLRGS